MKVYQYYIAWSPDRGDVAKYLHNATEDNSIKVYDLVLNVIEQLSVYRDGDTYKYALYAWTDKKEVAHIFEQTYDMNIFRRVVHKYSKEEFNQFKQECEDTEYKFDKEYPMYLTDIERGYMSDAIYMSVESDMTSIAGNYPYDILADEWFKPLDLLLYCTFWNFACGDMDYASSNWSYGCTAEGFGTKLRVVPNPLTCFIHYFYILLNKDTRIGVSKNEVI